MRQYFFSNVEPVVSVYYYSLNTSKQVASFASIFSVDSKNLSTHKYEVQQAHSGFLSLSYLFLNQEAKV